jgi:hypothetical protein
MSFGAVAGAAIGTIGGLIGANQQAKAAEGAANAQKAATKDALAQEQYQFDVSMQEYRRKQAILEQQQAQTTQLMTPYIQAGQGALFEMMALSGVAMPSQPVVPQGMTYQPGASEQKSLLPAQSVDASGNMTTQQGQMQAIGGVPKTGGIAGGLGMGTGQQPGIQQVEGVTNPYAGMTGSEAQAAAIENIAQSPLLQSQMQQAEEAMLQNASATGGLRGGNTQAALAQLRPQMLQQAIEQQYARLGGLSGAGQSAALNLPYQQTSAMPTSNAASYLQNLGSIEAAKQMSLGQTQANLYGDIASNLGTAAGAYFNRNQ